MKLVRNINLEIVLLATMLAPTAALCQEPVVVGPQPAEIKSTGTVASANETTLILRTDTGQFILFVYDRFAVKPKTIPPGSTVRILSTPRSDGVQVAYHIFITSAAPGVPAVPASPGTPATAQTKTSAPPPGTGDAVVPESIRDLERDIAKQARRFQVGVQGGLGLDPEVILLGLNSRIGSGFKDIAFRPNVDFAFGEVTKMFQINLDATYRLPLSPYSSKWAAYVGAGPNLSFVSQNFEKAAAGDDGVDFSEFEFKAGLNIITGIEYRSGMFYELKVGVWTTPVARFMIGYRF